MVLRNGFMTFRLVLFLFLLIVSYTRGQQAPRVEKRIEKNIDQVWPEKQVTRAVLDLSLSFPDNQATKYTDEVFLLEDNSGTVGYLVLSSAKGRYDFFDYMILYDTLGIIKNVDVLVYRSDHGNEIMNKGWLRQFQDTDGCGLNYGKDIDAISGATLSGNSLTEAISDWCTLLQRFIK